MGVDVVPAVDILRKVRQRTHRYSAWSRQQTAMRLGPEQPITCARGCSHCCRAKICIDAGSGAMIALLLDQTFRWTPELVERLYVEDALMTKATHASWYGSRPCVFLAADGTCSVYHVRPAGCINTYSVSDPDACRNGNGKAQLQLADLDLVDNLMPYHEALLQAAGETQTLLFTLPGAVLYGRAVLEGKPRPEVFSIARGDVPDDVNLWDHFDRAAGAV